MESPKKLEDDIQGKKCPLCPKNFLYLSRLQKHIQSHTQEKPFSCDKCDFKTSCEHHYKTHQDLVHLDKSVRESKLKFKCELCPFKAYVRSVLCSHMAKHKEERNFPCKFPGCEFRAKFSRVVWKHYKRLHRQDLPLMACEVEGCAYQGKSRWDVKMHMIRHSTDRPFHCSEANCDYKGKSLNLLKSHVKYKHCDTAKWYDCPLDGCTFKTKDRLYVKKHSIIHTGVKSFACSHPNCSYSSRTQKGVQDHATTHQEIKPYVCQVAACNYRAALMCNLKRHIKTHDQARPFPCPIEGCEYRAKIRSSLKPHLKCHNKEPKFPCPIAGCAYLARHNTLLAIHIKRHKIYPDFKECPVPGCNYWARNPNSFKRHQSAHNSELEFACPFCPRFFAIKPNLERHIYSHTKEKPFKCVYCDYGCAEKKSLIDHYRVHHQGEKFSLECLKPTMMCKHCSFVGTDEVVLKHTATQHSILTVNLPRIIINIF